MIRATVLMTLALALLPSSAWADDAAMSRFHYDQATRAYERGEYEDAVQQFFLAARLSPSSRTTYNIGVCFLQLRRTSDAFLFLSEYLASTDSAEGADERRAFAEQSIREMRRRVARVRVETDPPGATIYVDQLEHGTWGITPRVIALTPGSHHIWVDLPGYRRTEGEVAAAMGEEVGLRLVPDRILGNVRIISDVPGSARLLDARGEVALEGRTPLEGAVPPGRYDLEVSAPAHRMRRQPMSVREDQLADVRVSLEALPPPTGALAVTANTNSAVVEVDGEPAGFTPLALTGIATGDHAVRVTAPGMRPWQGEVEIEAERQAWVRVSLAAEPRGRSPTTWAFGGLGLAFLAGGVVTGVYALDAHRDFDGAYGELHAGALADDRRLGRRLNRLTDAALALGLVCLGTSITLFFATDDRSDRRSTADVSEGR